MIKSVGRRFLPDNIQALLSRIFGKDVPISYGYKVINGVVQTELLYGWQDPSVTGKQHKAFSPLLKQMHNGKPREDFAALADAVKMTGIANPFIIEVGCGSGWNSEVLSCLLRHPVHYIGVDYSLSMTAWGKKSYPYVPFVVGDATNLPFQDGICDILLSGTVLMHLSGYRKAISESRRLAKKWCIFHTVPVMKKRATTKLSKYAYGKPVVEVIFNEGELLDLIRQNGLAVRYSFDSIPYDLRSILQEPTLNKTYVCEITN
jgi:ubiquinone/menaquinone biosynthesis C-methylase UbiE